jgi:hypothetical protein
LTIRIFRNARSQWVLGVDGWRPEVLTREDAVALYSSLLSVFGEWGIDPLSIDPSDGPTITEVYVEPIVSHSGTTRYAVRYAMAIGPYRTVATFNGIEPALNQARGDALALDVGFRILPPQAPDLPENTPDRIGMIDTQNRVFNGTAWVEFPTRPMAQLFRRAMLSANFHEGPVTRYSLALENYRASPGHALVNLLAVCEENDPRELGRFYSAREAEFALGLLQRELDEARAYWSRRRGQGQPETEREAPASPTPTSEAPTPPRTFTTRRVARRMPG